jgi:hypothetical protein
MDLKNWRTSWFFEAGFCGLFPRVFGWLRLAKHSISGSKMHFANLGQNFWSVALHKVAGGVFNGC